MLRTGKKLQAKLAYTRVPFLFETEKMLAKTVPLRTEKKFQAKPAHPKPKELPEARS